MSHPPGPYPEPQYGPPPGQPHGTPQGPPPGYGPPPPHTGFGYGPPGGAPQPPKKKGGSGLAVLLVGGAVFVTLALGGAIVYLWLGPAGDSNDDNTSQSSSDGQNNDNQNSDSDADSQNSDNDAEFEGDWSGSMTQYDPDGGLAMEWDLRISLVPDSDTGTGEISLADGSCAMEYTIDQEHTDELQISYDVTGGTGSCVETGEITLSKSDSEPTLDAEVAVEWPDGTSIAEGTLSRD